MKERQNILLLFILPIIFTIVLACGGAPSYNPDNQYEPPLQNEPEAYENVPESEEKDIDTDSDGLSDAEEEDIGTDPYDPDTDGDGWTDWEETAEYGTNPFDNEDYPGASEPEESAPSDSDDDGLLDEDEEAIGTNPYDPDTDGDGWTDWEEYVDYGTSPFDYDDYPGATEPDAVTGGSQGPSPGVLPEEVYWVPAGAGGGAIEDCGDGIPNTYMRVQQWSESWIRLTLDETDMTRGKVLWIEGCDYPPGERISISLLLPGGTEHEFENRTTDEYGNWEANWWSWPGEPMGTYEYRVVSDSGSFEDTVYISESPEPFMLNMKYNESEAYLVLTGFQPGEEILIALYGNFSNFNNDDYRIALLDYWYLTIEQDGTAVTTFPTSNCACLYAIDSNPTQDTGEPPISNPPGILLYTAKTNCYLYR